jgi:hypothetical protein
MHQVTAIAILSFFATPFVNLTVVDDLTRLIWIDLVDDYSVNLSMIRGVVECFTCDVPKENDRIIRPCQLASGRIYYDLAKQRWTIILD